MDLPNSSPVGGEPRDFDDVLTVWSCINFSARRELLCYQDIISLRGICNHFCQVWGVPHSPFLVTATAAATAAATATPAAAALDMQWGVLLPVEGV